MRLTLRVVSQNSGRLGSSAAHTFGPEGGTIGRGKNANWMIADPERFLSSQHARIEFRNNAFYVIDTSTNGCFVNGALTPLGRDNEHQLRNGDQIMIGDFQIAASIDSGPVQMTAAAALRPIGQTVLGSGSMSSDPLAALDANVPVADNSPSTQIIPDDWDPKTAVGRRSGGGLGGGSGASPGSGGGGASGGFGFGSRTTQAGAVPPPAGGMPNNNLSAGNANAGGAPNLLAPQTSPPPYIPDPVMPTPGQMSGGQPPPQSGGQPDGHDRASIRPQRWDAAGNSSDGGNQDNSGIQVAPSPFAASPVFNRASTAPPATSPPAAASSAASPVAAPHATVPPPYIPEPVTAAAVPPPPYIPEPVVSTPMPPPAVMTSIPASSAPADPIPIIPTPATSNPATSIPVGTSTQMPVPGMPNSTTNRAGQAGGAMANDAVAAFWFALGVDAPSLSDADTADRLGEAGAALREMAGSIVQVLNARRMVKDEFRINQTQLQPTRNNALKFLSDGDSAVGKMLVEHDPAFLPFPEAVREAFDDIKAHELATMAGLREAVRALLDEFSPQTLEERFGATTLGRGSKSKYWDAFTELYNDVADNAENSFKTIFGEAFSRAYAEQMVLIRQQRRGT